MSNGITQAQFSQLLADEMEWTKRDADNVLDTVSELLQQQLRKNPTGGVSVRGIAKFTLVKKPATKARKGTNPFTGQPTTFKAKPASVKLKTLVHKKVRDNLSNVRFPKAK